MVEGASLIGIAADHGWHIESHYIAAGHRPARDLGAPVHELGPGVLERVASTETPTPEMAVVERRVGDVASLDACTFVLVADRVADPGNAGTMLRSAEAAGADAMVLTTGSVDVFNPKVVRASAGALFTVPVLVVDVDLEMVAARPGRTTVGTTSHAGVPYWQFDWRVPSTIVVGNEAHGLSPDAPVDEWVTIPHAGRAESLNVAMAATVLVFEVARQRSGE